MGLLDGSLYWISIPATVLFSACFNGVNLSLVFETFLASLFIDSLFFSPLSLRKRFFQTISRHLFFLFLEILSISLESVYQETFINETIIECFFFSKLIFGRFSLFRKFLIISNERQTI